MNLNASLSQISHASRLHVAHKHKPAWNRYGVHIGLQVISLCPLRASQPPRASQPQQLYRENNPVQRQSLCKKTEKLRPVSHRWCYKPPGRPDPLLTYDHHRAALISPKPPPSTFVRPSCQSAAACPARESVAAGTSCPAVRGTAATRS